MTKNTLSTIYTALTNYGYDNAEILSELKKELEKGAAEKAAKIAEYEAAWPAVMDAMATIGKAATVADIFNEAEANLPEGFTKSRVSYGMTHNWADRVIKTEGKVNLYSPRA